MSSTPGNIPRPPDSGGWPVAPVRPPLPNALNAPEPEQRAPLAPVYEVERQTSMNCVMPGLSAGPPGPIGPALNGLGWPRGSWRSAGQLPRLPSPSRVANAFALKSAVC